MAAEEIGEMFLCEGRDHFKIYKEVLESCYDKFVEKIFENDDKSLIIFKQDNASCHIARETKEWFQKTI